MTDKTIVLPSDSDRGDAPEPSDRATDQQTRPLRVEGYEILEELGRGGMGVVYRAEHQRLKRPVALKVVLSGAHSGVEERQRFRLEAETIASLKHAGIVQIYEVGEHDDRPFLALELVTGGDLHSHTQREPQSARWAAVMVERLARAVHYAHSQGVVHRDLKPANVLLESTPETTGEHSVSTHSLTGAVNAAPDVPEPKITDFGMAKQLDGQSNLTQTWSVIGTPSYMAPEQASGARNAEPRSDVYSLGAILYELLTGRPPFMSDNVAELLRMVLNDDPIPPRRLHRNVPAELETICLKCLEKSPELRFESAEALADDLTRFLRNEPIQARPISLARRAALLYRRNFAICNLLALFVVAIVASTAVYIVKLQAATQVAVAEAAKARKEEGKARAAETAAKESKTRAEDEKNRAEREQALAEARLRVAQIRALAMESVLLRDRDPPLSLLLAIEAVERSRKSGKPVLPRAFGALLSGVLDLRGETVHRDRDSRSATWFDVHPSGKEMTLRVHSAALHARGTVLRIPLGAEPGKRPRERTLVGGRPPIFSRYTPDGNWIATAVGKSVHLHGSGAKSGKNLLVTATRPIVQVIISGDSHFVAARDVQGGLQAWRIGETKCEPIKLNAKPARVSAIAFQPGTARLFAGTPDIVSAWELTEAPSDPVARSLRMQGSGDIAARPLPDRPPSLLVVSPGGQWVAAATGNELRLWKWPAGTVTVVDRRARRAQLNRVGFSHQGRYLAVNGERSPTIRVWQLNQGNRGDPAGLKFTLDNQSASFAFHPTKNLLASGGGQRTIKVWNLDGETPAPAAELRGHAVPIYAVRFSPIGTLYSSDANGEVRKWSLDPKAQQPRIVTAHPRVKVWSVRYAPDQRIYTMGADGTVRAWQRNGKDGDWRPQMVLPMRVVDRPNPYGGEVAVSPDGKYVAATLGRPAVNLWKIEGRQAVSLTPLKADKDNIRSLVFSPDGKKLYAGDMKQDLHVWRLDGDKAEHHSWNAGAAWIKGLAITADGRHLASAGSTRTQVKEIRLWDLTTDRPRLLTAADGHKERIHSLAFAGDSRTLVSTCDRDGRVWQWDGRRLQQKVVLGGHLESLRFCTISRDGRWMATCGTDKDVRLWDLRADKPDSSPVVLQADDSNVLSLSFSPDGEHLAAGTNNGNLVIWSIGLDRLIRQARRIAGRRLRPDERRRFQLQ